MQTLAQQALANTITVSDDAYKSISAIIAQIDFKLTEQIKLILQHPDWQKLESSGAVWSIWFTTPRPTKS